MVLAVLSCTCLQTYRQDLLWVITVFITKHFSTKLDCSPWKLYPSHLGVCIAQAQTSERITICPEQSKRAFCEKLIIYQNSLIFFSKKIKILKHSITNSKTYKNIFLKQQKKHNSELV